jgi:quinol monooxygenase YgiN
VHDLNALSNSPAPGLIVISRFRVGADQVAEFAANSRHAIAVLAACNGFIEAFVGQSTDEPDLLTITSRWQHVGAYRRALSTFDVKVSVIPFLSLAIDESSAYEIVHHRTENSVTDSASGLAADAGSIGLGDAAGPAIRSVPS